MKTIKLGELCDINPKDALPDKGTLVSFIPMQRVSETGQVDATETRQSEEVTKGFSSFREGDILMAKITPCMENGKGGIAKGLCNGIGYGSTEFHVIRPTSPLVRTEWIYYYTTYPRFRKLCEQNMTGSAGQKRVPKSYLLGCPIPVPNLNTQDKVIHSLRSLRSIIELRRTQLAKLDELVKCRFVELFGDVIRNDKKWPMCNLGDITSSRLGKMLDTKHKTGRNNYPYLANFNVQWFHFELNQLNEMDFDENEQIEFQLKDGDILVCEGGEIGRCAVWHNELEQCFFQKALHRVRCDVAKVLPDYVAWWFKYNCDHKGFDGIAGAKATIAHLPGVKLKKLRIAVPDIQLQEDFTYFLQHIDKLRMGVQAALDKAQTLFDSLMQEYFG